MNTKTSLCVVRFVGGPSDGLVLSNSHFRIQDKLRVRYTPAFVRCGQHSCYELVGYWSTAYLLTSHERAVEDGQPTTCLRYQFVGYELLKSQVEREPLRRSTPHRLAGLRAWFSTLRRKLVDWMLEPIGYPLKMPIEQQKAARP